MSLVGEKASLVDVAIRSTFIAQARARPIP